MNFGTIKDIFASVLVESHFNNDKKGKELYKNFLKILKENETLSTAFIVYKNIENKTIKNESLAIDYLKESISIFDKFRGEKSLSIQIKKLTSLLERYGVDYKSKETKPLHESLQRLILNKKDISNLDIIHEHKTKVINWLTSDKEIVSEDKTFVRPNVEPNKFLELAVSKFNEKYSELNEEEKNILKVLRENDEEKNKTLVLDLVKESVELVNKHLEDYADNVTVKSKLLETKDVIYKMVENNDSSSEKILKLYELKTNLKND